MKKFFYLAMAAVVGFAVASCKPEQSDKSTLTITVTDITGESATVTVTNSASDYFYWDVTYPQNMEGYENPYEYWKANNIFSEETYEQNKDIMDQMFGVSSYQELVKYLFCKQHEDSYTFEGLMSETTFLVYAFKIDTLGNLASSIFDTLTFTTLEGPSEEEKMYKFEPTEAGQYSMQAVGVTCDTYGDFFENNTTLFYTILTNANKESLTLDIVAPAGATAIPAGTYTVAAPADFAELTANQLLAGNFIDYSNYRLGTYMVIDGGKAAFWVTGGSINVAVNNDVYTISGTLTSHYGSTITVDYQGTISVEQPQQTPKRIGNRNIPAIDFSAVHELK